MFLCDSGLKHLGGAEHISIAVWEVQKLAESSGFPTLDVLVANPTPEWESELSLGLPWAASCFSSASACFHHRDAPPLLPSDTTQGYRTVKAKLGSKKVRPWKWMPFTNPARKDGAMFYHWRRAAEEGKDYPFARFNKVSGSTSKQQPINSSRELSFVSLLNAQTGSWFFQHVKAEFGLVTAF